MKPSAAKISYRVEKKKKLTTYFAPVFSQPWISLAPKRVSSKVLANTETLSSNTFNVFSPQECLAADASFWCFGSGFRGVESCPLYLERRV